MSLTAAWDELAAVIGPTAQRNAALGPLCTYRVGGAASLMVTIESTLGLEALSSAIDQVDIGQVDTDPSSDSGRPETLVVGKGSNLLVADAGFNGIALHLGEAFGDIIVDHSAATVHLGASAFLPVAARRIAAEGLTGFEWAVGVPGSVGGAVRMNAGGHGSDMASSVRSATVYNISQGRVEQWSIDDLSFGYRHSAVRSDIVVLSTELQLEPGDPARSSAELSEIVRWRRAHQPGGQNAGSVFANPNRDSAGRLIDAAGLKGLRIGSAEISTKHANFIQADANGAADDVYRLIREVQRRVLELTGIQLRCENLLIGFGDDLNGDDTGPSASPTGADVDADTEVDAAQGDPVGMEVR